MRSAVILLALLATGGVAAAGPNLADRQRSLIEARRAGAVAQARADRLAAAAQDGDPVALVRRLTEAGLGLPPQVAGDAPLLAAIKAAASAAHEKRWDMLLR